MDRAKKMLYKIAIQPIVYMRSANLFKEGQVTKKRGNDMKRLMNKEDREIKKKIAKEVSPKILEYRKKISDEAYLEHAINRIAADLSHYLTK